MSIDDLNDMQRYLAEEEAENWQDGLITRREFIRRITLLVGGAVAAAPVLLALGCDSAASEPTATVPAATATNPAATATTAPPSATSAPAGESPTAATGGASPYHVDENDPSVRGGWVDIPSPEAGVRLRGYLATSANKSAIPVGGVLVIHENRGITPHITDVVRRVAKAGYVGLCVDLVSRAGGSETITDEGQRTGILGQMPAEQISADLNAGMDYLKTRPEVDPAHLAAVGFCFGGGWTWRLATLRPDLRAAVPFYGPNPPLEDVPRIKAAMLGIYGGKDTRITGGAPALEAALKQAGVTYEMKIYDDADHAFNNDTGARYNAAAAADAWARTLEWFKGHI
jgi:carboxymethylenebutenolidase